MTARLPLDFPLGCGREFVSVLCHLAQVTWNFRPTTRGGAAPLYHFAALRRTARLLTDFRIRYGSERIERRSRNLQEPQRRWGHTLRWWRKLDWIEAVQGGCRATVQHQTTAGKHHSGVENSFAVYSIRLSLRYLLGP